MNVEFLVTIFFRSIIFGFVQNVNLVLLGRCIHELRGRYENFNFKKIFRKFKFTALCS